MCRAAIAFALVVAGGACGQLFDDAPPDAPTMRQWCEQIADEWRAAVRALDDSCVTASDCIVLEGHDTCETEPPSLGGCFGVAVNRAAYEARRDEIDGNGAGFTDCTCDDVDLCATDCGGGVAECYDGTCSSRQSDFCWMDLHDAAPADAPPPDAGAP